MGRNAKDWNDTCWDQAIAEMIEMGFEYSSIVEAIKVVGPSVPSAVEHILNSATGEPSTTHTSNSHALNGNALKKRPLRTGRLVRQSKIFDHFHSNDDVTEHKEDLPQLGIDPNPVVLSEPFEAQYLDAESDWEQKVSNLMKKHFGFSSLKGFQKEAISAWVAHKDCLVLAATGSGNVCGLPCIALCIYP